MGGGLGHLTRAYSFLHTFSLIDSSFILTSSQFVDDKRVIGNCKIIQVNKKFEKDISLFQEFLHKTFTELNIKTIFLDSFPLGIIGEFADFDFQDIEVNYVARLLRWNNYSQFIKTNNPKFAKTYLLETLETEHQKFIDENSASQTKLGLVYPKSNLSKQDKDLVQLILDKQKPFWLIVHSGNEEEILELVNYAEEMREIENANVNLVLVSPNKFNHPKLFQCDIYPASVLFDKAEKIFTACGFNSMNQLKHFRSKHNFIPFERRFDNQFLRAKRFRESL